MTLMTIDDVVTKITDEIQNVDRENMNLKCERSREEMNGATEVKIQNIFALNHIFITML